MAIKIDKENCIGCGACVGTCPFGALEMQDNKVDATVACTSCGACVDVCPVSALELEKIESTATVDKKDYSGVWVFIDHHEGSARCVSHELLGQGRVLADKLGQEFAAVVIGGPTDEIAKDVIASGADKVYIVEGEEYTHYNPDTYTIAFVDLINTYKPNVVLLGATVDGRDLGPRVACRVKTGLTADCTNL
ncbi:MAG: 4Fe-4S binding protein, partial [Candidatus Gastranaerophilaceae bacterium]